MNDFRRWMNLCEDASGLARIRKKSKVPVPDTNAFRQWFGQSKVVDKRGKPLICYHGTHTPIEAFNKELSFTGLIFFSTNPGMADGYAKSVNSGVGGNVIPVYLRIDRPYDHRVADNEEIAYEFYRANGSLFGDDAWQVRIALYGDPEIEDDENERIHDESLDLSEYVEALDKGLYPALEAHDFLNFIQAKGFDGIVTHEVRSVNFGVFAASQAKSVFAREFNSESDHLSEDDSLC